MIAFIGYAERATRFGLGRASVATAAVALARTGGDLLMAVDMLNRDARMREFTLSERRVPILPTRASFAVMADMHRNRLAFFACNTDWSHIGDLEPDFELDDVEAVESMLMMTLPYRPQLRAVAS